MLYLFSLYLLIPQSVSNTVWDPYHEAFQSDVIMIFYSLYLDFLTLLYSLNNL
jgi:hypothetical protein